MLPSKGDSTEPWVVPMVGSEYSSPSRTPTCRHLPMSLISDSSAIRSRSISISILRSMLSKKDTMSASRRKFTSPRWMRFSSSRIAS